MADVSHDFESGGWQFTPEVAAVFDQHVAANVPNYHLIQDMVAHLSDWLAPSGALVVDVGASTGTTVKAISDRHPNRLLNFLLYDVEDAMLERARLKLADLPVSHDVNFRSEDLTQEISHGDADLTLALFFLQFLPPHTRGPVLKGLAQSARPETGYLVVAEKVEQETAFWQEIANEATWDYKASQGIDPDTIRAKARALRGVLTPLPSRELVKLIADNGWHQPVPIYRWHSWGIWACKVRAPND